MRKDALISPCGLYRYWLKRHWEDDLVGLPVIMLNPSTADAEIDDPTIKRCMEFARREGYGGITVLNVFALRATNPEELKKVNDPNGPDNNDWLKRMMGFHELGGSKIILVAWGANKFAEPRAAQIIDMAKREGAQLVCLGTSKNGAPKHPLYIKGDQPFMPFGK